MLNTPSYQISSVLRRQMFVTALGLVFFFTAIANIIIGMSSISFLSGDISPIIHSNYFPEEGYNEDIKEHIKLIFKNLLLVSEVLTYSSIIVIPPALGLLIHKEWGRLSFITLQVLIIFLVLILSAHGIKVANEFFTPEILSAGSAFTDDNNVVRRIYTMIKAMLLFVSFIVTLFNLWTIWKLTRPEIIDEFN